MPAQPTAHGARFRSPPIRSDLALVGFADGPNLLKPGPLSTHAAVQIPQNILRLRGKELREEASRMVEHWCGGVCSLSMATSAATATALLRPSRPAVPAKRRCLHAVAGRTTTGRRTAAAGILRACFNPLGDERILREAMKEPVAFMGGVFAGLLRLDLNEDPLKEWITRTVEASGIAEENSAEESSEADQNDAPQQIEIE